MDWASYTLWIARIFLACRVSILSALAGILLFALAPQARDLFADISFGALPDSPDAWRHWLLFFTLLIVVWAFPVHYAARRMLETNEWMFPRRVRAEIGDASAVAAKAAGLRPLLKNWIDWVPRGLGMAPFVAVLIGLWKAYWVAAGAQALGADVDARTQIKILASLDVAFAVIFLWLLVKRRTWLGKITLSGAILEAIAIASALIVTAIFAFSYVWPFLPADIAPRALVVPFLFGSLVFLATLLAWTADLTGFPILALTIVGALSVTALNSHFNDMRLIAGAPRDPSSRQIDIDVAIDKWKVANHCDVEHCPPALIVAAEGGASRAAFALATALGELFDHADKLPDGRAGALTPARRIFAISGVSGGAFGAATIRTALLEALSKGQTTPPCKNPSAGWFTTGDHDVTTSWRACLQALVAGDYLTPAFVGLGFRDNLAPPNPLNGRSLFFTDDRAALVERAWERHFDQIVKGPIPTLWQQLREDLGEGKENETGLGDRFGYLLDRLRVDDDWLPLLLLNSTSVDSGTRIIVSDLISTRKAPPSADRPAGREPLYPAALDLFEMLSTPCSVQEIHGDSCDAAHKQQSDQPNIRNGRDVRLSTAAMLSARFPIVSPAGIIHSGDDPKAGDRAVDGGYFENSGLTTALDVARALKKRHITPIVLWVHNDPAIGEGDPLDAEPAPALPPRGAGTPHLGSAAPSGLEAVVGVISTPFSALVETRSGHENEEAAHAQRSLDEMNLDTTLHESRIGASWFTFGMFKHPHFQASAGDANDSDCRTLTDAAKKNPPVLSEVSMSWWLSQAVRAELDSQICDVRNLKSFDNLMERLSQSLIVQKAL